MRRNKKSKILLATLLTFVAASSGLFYFIHSNYFPDLSFLETIQSLANPSIRYVKINPGMRKEEVVERFSKALGWSEQEKKDFLKNHSLAMKGKSEGYFYPNTYIVSAKANSKEVSKKIADTFNKEVARDLQSKSNVINMDTAVKIASIIQREAYDERDMKIISGIIWNRLFNNMSLQMDATLQYAKGNKEKWWPKVKPEDKYIKSPFNTYKNKGLPPAPISNPGKAAINAALNPAKTSALFYLHDANGRIHTAKTYEEHVANIERYY